LKEYSFINIFKAKYEKEFHQSLENKRPISIHTKRQNNENDDGICIGAIYYMFLTFGIDVDDRVEIVDEYFGVFLLTYLVCFFIF